MAAQNFSEANLNTSLRMIDALLVAEPADIAKLGRSWLGLNADKAHWRVTAHFDAAEYAAYAGRKQSFNSAAAAARTTIKHVFSDKGIDGTVLDSAAIVAEQAVSAVMVGDLLPKELLTTLTEAWDAVLPRN